MSNQKGFSKIAIIIIVLILIGGAYFVFGKKGKNIPAQNIGNQNGQSKQSSGESLSIDNWKTYRNDKYGFEFKYPEKLFLSESVGTGKPRFWVGYEKIKNKFQPEGERAESVGVLVYDNLKNLNTEDFLTSLEENENWKKWSSQLSLNGLMAIKIEGRPSIGIETGTEYENTDIYLKNNNLVYVVYYDRIGGLSDLENVFNQILSTFKITH